MCTLYGYARISRKEQSIDRQIRNLYEYDSDIKIYQEAFTGRKMEGRDELNRLLRNVSSGDTIVFDSVSRMSRNADEGIELYFKLFDEGINLVFLKEHHIDTDTYRNAASQSLEKTGNEIADIYIEATNRVIKLLAEKQIRQAFEQAQKEVDDLRERTSEGLKTARLNGKQIGQKKGNKLHVKKEAPAKEKIIKLSKDFKGSNSDVECIKIIGISRNTYYKYKRELSK